MTLEEIKTLSHDTIVTGFDAAGVCVFLKSYNYEAQEEEAQADLKRVQEAGLEWNIGAFKQVESWKAKAEKWDALEAKISAFYADPDDEDIEEGDLGDIGEVAASAFGYL